MEEKTEEFTEQTHRFPQRKRRKVILGKIGCHLVTMQSTI